MTINTKSNNIVWLASYPKSGNTWIRILLGNYLSDKDEPIDINNINTSVISSSRAVLDNQLPYLSSDITFDEIDNIRPQLYKEISGDIDSMQFIKTHDAFTKNTNGENIFPLSVSKGVVHIVRNPIDVAVSFAHHSNISIDKSIAFLNSKTNSFADNPKKLNKQLRQILLSWSSHYLSWEKSNMPYLLVKYEDLIKDTTSAFRDILHFLYKEVNEEKLQRAVKFSSFKELKKQESKTAFLEKPLKAKSFFRKGEIGSGFSEMNNTQIDSIIGQHKEIMRKLGYLDNI